MSRLSASRLRQLRNELPIDEIIELVGLPAKTREGVLRFLCPLCKEFNTATNPRTTNLARCFRCARNFNPIDLVMVVRDCPFLEAVRLLETIRAPPR